jgi:YidC/Oxa1 family membrane protein insertase
VQLTPRKIENKSTAFNPNAKTAAITNVENDVIKVEFSSLGAQPRSVYLKNYNRYDGKIVKLNSSDSSQLNYNLLAAFGNNVNINQINFTLSKNTVNADQSKTIEYEAHDSLGNIIKHTYTMRPGDYMLDLDISFQSASKAMQGKQIALEWKVEAPKIEKDSKYELTQQHFCHYSEDSYDFNYCQQNDQVELQSTDWIAVKQQFFLSALVAKNKFSSVNTSWTVSQDPSSDYLTRTSTTAIYPLQSNGSVAIPLRMYFGPSDYNILKNYNNHMQSIVPYGSGIFAFVKYINRHFLLPVFDWLKNHIANMGIVILLITLLIRLITSPILYKSYLSGAKMKALKPEVDALRAKYKDDQQAFGMEQMKLWKSAGVSPLGGCIPALLQIPIFMSLYFFFQSNIGLRGASFLWSQDLSQYDSIANLPFSIPFYGDHVSLFTITAVLTSLLISLYGMSNMQDNNNPFMKYLPFIFPVLLLGVFNSLPAALTWYYTISNTITLIMQIVIQKYIINHEKILADINENRKKPVKKSKMQERIEAMQESQRKLQEMKKKGNV